jgi:hypothetical protein
MAIGLVSLETASARAVGLLLAYHFQVFSCIALNFCDTLHRLIPNINRCSLITRRLQSFFCASLNNPVTVWGEGGVLLVVSYDK